MNLLPSGEQDQIVASVRDFLADSLPVTRLHGRAGNPADLPDSVWRQAVELGFFSLGLAEADGGVGYGLVEEVLLFREVGRVVGPAGFLFGAIAAKIAAAAGRADITARILDGSLRTGYAAQEDFSGPPDTLHRRRVFDHAHAGVVIVDHGDRFRLFDVAGRNFEPAPALDRSVSMSIADLAAAPVLADIAAPAIRRAASLLTAAMLLGIAEATRDMIVDYAKIRTTFGRPIGAYQAVRHPCADMAARCALAEAQLFYAALAATDGHADADLHAGAARVLAQDAAARNVDDNIQLHGGIGVTDEFTAHFFLKRAVTAAGWFGERRTQLARVLATKLAARMEH